MILFITRKFPPSRGGMERVAYELSQQFSKIAKIKLVAWGGANKWLPLVLPCLFFKALWFSFSKNIQVIYVEDSLLAPLGLALKILTRKPVVITIHGKDITYDNALYQFLIPRTVRKLDRIICISEATKQQCVNRGISPHKMAVIPDGISDEFIKNVEKQQLREQLSRELGIRLNNQKVILSVGRLVERKGIHWFVENVMPLLIKKGYACIYIIAGDGSFYPQIRKIIEQNKLESAVFMLGRVSDEMLRCLYNACDIFIMPNIPVRGDMEGFGLVTLEASSCGLPVVASDLEGIREAIQNGKNGILVEPGNAQGFIDRVRELLENDEMRAALGKRARQYTLENYGWEKIAQHYLEEFAKSG